MISIRERESEASTMETLSRVSWLQFTITSPLFGGRTPNHHPNVSTLRIPRMYVLKTPSSASERAEDDVLQEFFRERQLNGDLITKYCDILFQRRAINYNDAEANEVAENSKPVQQALGDEPEGGFLKLKETQEWLLGGTSAPFNKKPTKKEVQYDRERTKRLNLLRYEALKKELLFMTLGVGAACTAYCLLTLSIQAAVSYASGVGFSCLYLQLLYQHADNISKDSVPQIFLQKKQKKQKKIGIQSVDLQNLIGRSVKGSRIALSSPRLVIPAAVFGLYVLLHRNFANDVLDFQIVPAMLGMFAYKAAALIQAYRDNEDLKFIFPDDEESSNV